MFSSNDIISSRQIKRLLVFDLFGAGSLILPAQLARSGNGIGVWSILAGMAFAGIYLWLLHTCSSRTVSDYMGFLKTGWGNILSRLLYLCYAVISILVCAWAAKLLTELVCDSLLDSREFMTALLVILLLAFYGASAGIEARARIYEILYVSAVCPAGTGDPVVSAVRKRGCDQLELVLERDMAVFCRVFAADVSAVFSSA